MDDFDKKLGKHLRDLRKSQGISQGELANRLGISNGTLSNYESGRRKVSVQTFFDIYTALGLYNPNQSGDYLFAEDYNTWFYREADSVERLKREFQLDLFSKLCRDYGYSIVYDEELAEENAFILSNNPGVEVQKSYLSGSRSEKYIPEEFNIKFSEDIVYGIEEKLIRLFGDELDQAIREQDEKPLSESFFCKGIGSAVFDEEHLP